MIKKISFCHFVGFCVLLLANFSNAELPELISRAELFQNPSKTSPKISPDGKLLAYSAPLDGVLNIWIQNLEGSKAYPVTYDKQRGIRRYYWTGESNYILYLQKSGKSGDGGSKRQSMPVVLIKQRSVMKKRENVRSVENFKKLAKNKEKEK